ncbi:hypothetical protein AB3G45_04010, partial [Shinella sp. S4-D37]
LTAMVIARIGGHPGWWAHFYFSCVELQNSMAGFKPPFSLAVMLKGYVNGAMNALSGNHWIELLAACLLGWRLLATADRGAGPRFNALMFALAIAVAGKFASFPLPEDRYYFALVAGMILLIVTNWKPQFSSVPPRPR